jgi:tetratricopeptide (TPR) repeat protein
MQPERGVGESNRKTAGPTRGGRLAGRPGRGAGTGLAIFALAAALLGVVVYYSSGPSIYMTRGVEAQRRGDFVRAASWFQREVQRDPAHAPAWLRLGECNLRLSPPQWVEARPAFLQAIKLQPALREQVRREVVERGLEMIGEGDAVGAVGMWQEAPADGPDFRAQAAAACEDRGRTLAANPTVDPARAARFLRVAVDLVPSRAKPVADCCFNLAQQNRLIQPAKASDYAQLAAEFAPDIYGPRLREFPRPPAR